mmetsp:Transcript_89852/g.288035  ORF Transcript_89852/g.288035 Transcript_89852/m.288035 type:complete len:271 (-) Transcript_89852:46-858(-)
MSVPNRHDPRTRTCNLQRGTRPPNVLLRVVNLAGLQGLHESLPRCVPDVPALLQGATAHGVDEASKGGAAVAPPCPGHGRHSILLPAPPHGVVDIASLKQSIHDAPLVVATHHHDLAAGQHRRSASCSAGRHRRTGHPTAVPRVEHLDRIKRAMSMISSAEGVEHVRERRVESQEWCDVLRVPAVSSWVLSSKMRWHNALQAFGSAQPLPSSGCSAAARRRGGERRSGESSWWLSATSLSVSLGATAAAVPAAADMADMAAEQRPTDGDG